MSLGVAIPAALATLLGAIAAGLSGSTGTLNPLIGAGLLSILLVMIWRPRALPWLVLGGWVFIGIHQEWASRLPAGLNGEDVMVEASLLSVTPLGGSQRLMLAIDRCEAPVGYPNCHLLRKVRVTAYGDADYQPGEQWQMLVRLRPPSGFANPHSFDFEQWLWREGIHATGYVRQEPAPERIAAAGFSVRRLALEVLDSAPLEARTQRWLAALTLGEGDRLTQDDWTLLNATGTTHLVVISGLHVGLVAGFGLLLARTVARFVSPLNWRMRVWPWWVAAATAVGYALLAGLAPPAMRAMVMTLVGLWVLSGRHAPGVWQAWWLALALVILVDPLSLWRPGLWLSFLAVAWLMVIWQGRARPQGIKGWCLALLRSQLLLAPLMAAAVLIAFGRIAPGAPIINLVAVPWVSSVMVPLALVGWLFAPLPLIGTGVWWLFEQALSVLHTLLTQAMALWPLWEPDYTAIYPLSGALLLLALCWGLPGISAWLRAGAIMPVALLPFWSTADAIPDAALRVTVHDVGQGQLVELRSSRYRLLYDTGPRFQTGFMPLQALWSPNQHFEQVIVSHADSDHAGGVSALVNDHRVEHWYAPVGETLPIATDACQRGQTWQRDGVTYRFLWPPAGPTHYSANDRSCVLEVSIGEQRLLITGDVSRDIERRFLRDIDLPVSVLIAGHHGSLTSSGVQFVQHTSPRHVIFSAGRNNRFHHPVDTVVRRFNRQGSCLWNTGHDGALRFWLKEDQPVVVKPTRRLSVHTKRC
ncbi:DNA internalization-related competence protein ComEC/Rec2 [Vreelandella populi]|uniref:DNA internalization-related competence protein ComEC/Rec2 n=1 Tax=Vreelandella populi TaxID=2498858 RepID=A0A433LAK0_9GAMM|nr:DNA internalization-related competence protein ComEC/Rec2 [Halomonas populi]RUR42597.1 DNA internalization-related competence protein ComEC/Rec2 [Halomonas populi]RUR45800.1 DNA internalization-related competence protein ComEC/Rec2 [Halomonas populi]RUR57104.1 DNA internalization-related competence protein ComEC/Rec2 [Halomonas populi]